MQKKEKISWMVIGGAFFSCALWSSALPVIKIGLKYTSPLFFAGVRFMLAGLLLLPFCMKHLRSARSDWWLVLRVAMFQTFLLYGFFYLGMTYVSGALGAIMVGTSPLVIAIVAHFATHNDKLTLKKLFSFGMGAVGIVIVSLSRKPWTSAGWQELLGILLLLGGSVASAFGNLIVSKNKNKISVLLLTGAQMFVGGLLLLLLSFIVEGMPHVVAGSGFFLSLGWLSFLSAAAFSIWFALLQKDGVTVSELNIWKFVIPVLGSLLSWQFVSGERPEAGLVLGMVVITLSILIFYAKWGQRSLSVNEKK